LPRKLFKTLFVLTLVVSIGVGEASVSAKDNQEQPLGKSRNQIVLNADKRYYDAETGQTISNIYQITEDGYKEITFEEFKRSEM